MKPIDRDVTMVRMPSTETRGSSEDDGVDLWRAPEAPWTTLIWSLTSTRVPEPLRNFFIPQSGRSSISASPLEQISHIPLAHKNVRRACLYWHSRVRYFRIARCQPFRLSPL